jgi:hypothetical protein
LGAINVYKLNILLKSVLRRHKNEDNKSFNDIGDWSAGGAVRVRGQQACPDRIFELLFQT